MDLFQKASLGKQQHQNEFLANSKPNLYGDRDPQQQIQRPSDRPNHQYLNSTVSPVPDPRPVFCCPFQGNR